MIFEARIYEKFLCKEENIDTRGNERNGKGGRRKEEGGENGKETKFHAAEEDVRIFEQRYLQPRIRRSGGIFYAKELKT